MTSALKHLTLKDILQTHPDAVYYVYLELVAMSVKSRFIAEKQNKVVKQQLFVLKVYNFCNNKTTNIK